MEYRVLGPLEVRDGDGSLPLAGAKQRALLALLLVNANRVVSRERLVDELWGDEPPATAVTSVQVYVSRLRKLLLPDALVTRPPGYLLKAEPGQIDLQRFEQLVADARKAEPEGAARLLREALALWRGPPFAEFREPFAQIEGGRLDDLRLAALEERVEADLALGRHSELIGELEALIAEHPHRERLRGQLMLALYRSDRQAEALEAYRQARAVLDELGIEPGERLRELEKAILTQDTALDVPRALFIEGISLPGPLRVTSPFPFVGRAKELDALRAVLARVESGEGGQVALVGGEAGSGKTRLARELAHEAAERGTLVLYGAAYADVNLPYQPFLEALEFLMRFSDPSALAESIGGGRDDLARLLPGLRDSAAPPPDDPQTARRRLHNAIGELFARVSRERPVFLVVDDIHWADASSLELLRRLTRDAPEARIFLLATYRDRSEDIRPELTTALADLSRHEGITRIGVRPLLRDDIAEFIERSFGANPTSELTEAIGSLTDGTPFLVCELWRALVDANTLEITDDGVGLTRPVGELSSPESVRDVVHYRLSRLAPATTAMLEVAAVAGPEFELKLLGDDANVPSAAHEAVEKGVLDAESETGTGYRFTHELVRRALYDRLTSVRRAQLHLQVGEELERIHAANVDPFLAELAHHFTLASGIDGVERAIDYNVRTAAAAARLFAYDEVAKRLSIALELGIADRGRRAGVELDLGNAFHQTGKLAEAETMLARAVADSLSAEAEDLRAHASILHHHVRMRTDRQAAQSAVRSVAQEAIDVFNRSGDHGGLAQAWRLLSHAAILECQWGEANDALDVALEHAKSTADRRECPKVVAWLLSALYYGPTPALEGIQRYEELVELCADHPYMDAATACNRAALLAMIGRFEEARAEGQRGLATLEELGMSVHATACRAPVWDAEFLAGDAAAAERELLTAHEAATAAGDHAAAVSFGFDLAWLLCLQERYSEAEAWAATGRGVLETMDVMVRLIGFGAEAELASSKGEIQIAEQFARRAVDLAETADAPCIAARAYVSVSRALHLANRGEGARTAREKAAVLYESKGNVTAATQIRTAALSMTDSSRSRRSVGRR